MEKVTKICEKLNLKKKFVMDLIKNKSIKSEIRGGSYYVSLSEIKKYLKQTIKSEDKVLPSLIKKIFVETQKDFESSEQQLGFSSLPPKKMVDIYSTNIYKIVYDISNGKKNTLTKVESQLLYNQSKNFSDEFSSEIENIDYSRLESDTTVYYEELYKKYFDRWCYYGDSQSSIKCEKFILNHYLLHNYDIDSDFDDGINYSPSDESYYNYVNEERNNTYQSEDGFTDYEFNSLVNSLKSKNIDVTVVDLI